MMLMLHVVDKGARVGDGLMSAVVFNGVIKGDDYKRAVSAWPFMVSCVLCSWERMPCTNMPGLPGVVVLAAVYLACFTTTRPG